MNVTQETDRVPGKGILVSVACLTAISAIGVAVAYFITDRSSAEFARTQRPPLYVDDGPGPSSGPSPGAPPAPGVVPGQVPEEVNQIEEVLFSDRAPGLEERAYEHTLLRSYGWVNRDARLVRIPIDRAIELYVQRNVQNPEQDLGQAPGEDQP
jgi:hypothetical protein